MHAFDAEKLHGTTIFVRSARAGEKIVALNDETYNLTPSNLVIADAAWPHRDRRRDRRTAQRHRPRLPSASCWKAPASRRLAYAKHRWRSSCAPTRPCDSRNRRILRTLFGAWRALWNCCEQVSPGIRLVGGMAEQKAEFESPPPIELSVDWIASETGPRSDCAGSAVGILESLEFSVEEIVARTFSVKVPSWRATKDVSMKDDLLEEVGRMLGYDSITPQAPLIESVVPPDNPMRARTSAACAAWRRRRDSPKSPTIHSSAKRWRARSTWMPPEAHLRVSNPIASDQTLMRFSLLPGNPQEHSRKQPPPPLVPPF